MHIDVRMNMCATGQHMAAHITSPIDVCYVRGGAWWSCQLSRRSTKRVRYQRDTDFALSELAGLLSVSVAEIQSVCDIMQVQPYSLPNHDHTRFLLLIDVWDAREVVAYVTECRADVVDRSAIRPGVALNRVNMLLLGITDMQPSLKRRWHKRTKRRDSK